MSAATPELLKAGCCSSAQTRWWWGAPRARALSTLIRTVGFAIAFLIGIGAVFGAILAMYTAVATRAREIATLRALRFNTLAVIVSVLAESLALAFAGGVIGGVVAY